MSTWILTGGIENFRIYTERDFDVIGMKEGRRRMAEGFEPGDDVEIAGMAFELDPGTRFRH